MDREAYEQLINALQEKVRPGYGGAPNPAFVAEVGRLTREIERASGHHSYICEKAAGVREWVDRACSHRRFKDWGLDKVEHFAFSDAYRLSTAVGLVFGMRGERS